MATGVRVRAVVPRIRLLQLLGIRPSQLHAWWCAPEASVRDRRLLRGQYMRPAMGASRAAPAALRGLLVLGAASGLDVNHELPALATGATFRTSVLQSSRPILRLRKLSSAAHRRPSASTSAWSHSGVGPPSSAGQSSSGMAMASSYPTALFRPSSPSGLFCQPLLLLIHCCHHD